MTKMHLDTIKCLALAVLIFAGFAAQNHAHTTVTQDHQNTSQHVLSKMLPAGSVG